MTFGKWGEEVAVGYLKRNGYEILERNYRCRRGEIDVIAKKGEFLCFVEVKSRRGLGMGFPGEAVTEEKKNHLRIAAKYYIQTHGVKGAKFLRMDVIEVLKLEGKTYLRHIENAFE